MELISDYSKVTWYKVNIQKSIDFLSTINEQLEREIKKKKNQKKERKKYLGINLTKHMEGLYEGNYKTMMKEIRSK